MPAGPIAVLAGAGQLPIQLVNHLERTGQEVRVLAFRGFAEAELQRHADATVDLLDLKTIMSTLEEWRPSPSSAPYVGPVSPRSSVPIRSCETCTR